MRHMKIAVIQLAAQDDKEQNLKQAFALVYQAAQAKAELIALPEVFHFRGKVPQEQLYQQIAENIPGRSTAPFLQLARDKKVHILLGSIYERRKKENKISNTSILINPQGKIAARYRKIHLFDAVIDKKVIRESKNFLPGRQLAMAKVKNFNLGLTICYDLRFSNLYRRYSQKGCDIIAVPSSFTKKTGVAHWEILLRARAIETLSYVIAPNQVGKDRRGIETYGNSMIISPWGEVLAKASADKTEIIYAELRKDYVEEVRKIFLNRRRRYE